MAAACCNCVPVVFTSQAEKAYHHSGKVTNADIKENIRIIEIHRRFVYCFGKTIYPEYDFIAHDLSKFSSEELVPYTLKFINKVPDSENPGWDTALEHHYKNNPHHPQYWGDKPMPEEFLKESLVDMIAARYQYREEMETLPTHLNKEMFDMNPIYLTRYSDTDREKVNKELQRLLAIDWSKIPVYGHSEAFGKDTRSSIES